MYTLKTRRNVADLLEIENYDWPKSQMGWPAANCLHSSVVRSTGHMAGTRIIGCDTRATWHYEASLA
jgi:hypothetical protein